MPNIVSNRLEITAPTRALLEDFMKKAECTDESRLKKYDDDKLFALDKLIPIPPFRYSKDGFIPLFESDWSDEIKEMIKYNKENFGYPTEINWCIDNWGTQYLESVRIEQKTDTSVVYTFDSARSMPDKSIKKISADFPELTFFMVSDYGDYDMNDQLFVEVKYLNGKEIEYAEFIIIIERNGGKTT